MRKTTHSILIFSLLFALTDCFAQTETINTDRPDQSDGVYTVPKHILQLENGFTIANKVFLNNFMLRYGLTNTTEIRLLLDAGKEVMASGLKPVTISAKQRLIQQDKILPAITFVGYISFDRLASKDFQDDLTPFELKLAFENELTDQFSIAYNVGTSEKFEALNLTFNFGFSPTDDIATFIEYFSTFNKLETEHNIDAGLLFVLNPQLQLDVAFGGPFKDFDDGFFTTFGVSYVFR